MRLMQAIAGGRHGGAEAFFVRLAGALARAGVEQRLLVRRGRPWLASLTALGLEPVELRFGGLFDLGTGARFRREIETFAPDLVLTWMNRATRVCPAPGGRRRFVHVARLGGYYDLKYYRRCDHLIANTAAIVTYIRGRNWPAERVHYVPNFVAAVPGPPLPRGGLETPDGAPLVLALGRLHRNKAFDLLLAAMARLPEVYLWLAGEGPERAALERQAGALGLRDRVRFLGWRDDVAALFAAADIFACPSRIEPLGNVVIEAWAHRVPVVAAASAGPAALLTPGETGLLVPLEDAEALATSIQTLIGTPALAERLRAAGREAYEQSYTEAAVVEQYCRFFARVAA